MDLIRTRILARELMTKHGLTDWEIDINYSMRTTFGRCHNRKKVISMSAILSHINPEYQVEDTILHEIAHALREIERGNIGQNARHFTANQYHDSRWKQIAASLGCTPSKFYDGPEAASYGRAPVRRK